MDRLVAEHLENPGGSLEQWIMRVVAAVLPAGFWLLFIARGFDQVTVEGAMTITGWAILGAGPAAFLVRRRFWRTATAVGLFCIVVLPGGWWSLQVDLPEPRPLRDAVQGTTPPSAPFDAGSPRADHRVGPTSLMSRGARWLVPVPDTRIPDGLFLDVARASWYSAWSLGALMYMSAPFLAPAVTLLWLAAWPGGRRRRVRGGS